MTIRTTSAFLVGIALLSAACIVPVRETSRRTVRQERSNVEVVRSGMVQLATSASGSTVTVVATRPRACRADVVDVVEETTWIAGELDGGEVCTVAPVARAETTVTRVRTGQNSYPCSQQVAGLEVHLRLSSGDELAGVTDAAGVVAFEVPPEHASGSMTLTSAETYARSFAIMASHGHAAR